MISDSDKTRVAEAIAAAEARTSGEIFCVVSRHSGDYRFVPVLWAAFAALLVPLPLLFAAHWTARAIYAAQLAAFFAVSLVLSYEPLLMRAVPRRVRREHAHAEAMRQFFAQGLDRTEDRTGVLIFASEAERYAEIVSDRDISERVPPAVWDDAMAALIGAIKDGRPADGFVAAVERCGAVLATHFPPGALKRDALPNRLLET